MTQRQHTERDKDHTHARYQSSVAAASSRWAERPSQPARSGGWQPTPPPPGASCSPSGRRRRRRANVVHLAGTDGWVAIPAPATQTSYAFPDNLAPEGKTTYVFGFRDVTGLTATSRCRTSRARRRSARRCCRSTRTSRRSNDVQVTLTNLGLRSGPTSSTATPCTGTASSTRSRSSTACPSCRSRCRSGATSPTSTARTTRARTCTTATSRTSSTCRWA